MSETNSYPNSGAVGVRNAYQVICRSHGTQRLSRDNYLKQLEDDNDWECPKGGPSCQGVIFDEQHYENVMGVKRRGSLED